MAAWRSTGDRSSPFIWRLALLPRFDGVTRARYLLFGANTPWKRVRLALGLGTRAASRAMKSNGPVTTTETSASLAGRRPFAWCLFLIVIFVFPLFGGVLHLIFWLATSKATVFLHVEDGELVVTGDQWLMQLQEAQSEAYVDRQQQIKERGFLPVMWPQLVVSLGMIALWIYLLKTFM
jgi:hypothetical protein